MSNPPPIAKTKTKTETETEIETETETKGINLILKRVHTTTIVISQIIISAILTSIILWLFIRIPQPEVHCKSFNIEAFTNKSNPNSTLVHYKINIHNPDFIKTIYYDILVLRINVPYNIKPGAWGITVNFPSSLHQRPGQTTTLPNFTANYSVREVGLTTDNLKNLMPASDDNFIKLRLVMEFSVRAFNRVVAKRQTMEVAQVFFHDNGSAFIVPRGGIPFM